MVFCVVLMYDETFESLEWLLWPYYKHIMASNLKQNILIKILQWATLLRLSPVAYPSYLSSHFLFQTPLWIIQSTIQNNVLDNHMGNLLDKVKGCVFRNMEWFVHFSCPLKLQTRIMSSQTCGWRQQDRTKYSIKILVHVCMSTMLRWHLKMHLTS